MIDVHVPPELAAALERNPLLHLCFTATTLAELTNRRYGSDDEFPLMPWLRLAQRDDWPSDGSGRPVYPTREMAGIAGLQTYLESAGEWDVMFVNDLSWERHGIDAVARDRRTGRYVLCEAKGSSSRHLRGPAYHLARTRHKGRQLSWRWCWQSLAEFAAYGPTAALFLAVIEPFLHGDTERLLVVTRVQAGDGGYRAAESRAWDEAALAVLPELRDPDALRQPREWLRDFGTTRMPVVSTHIDPPTR